MSIYIRLNKEINPQALLNKLQEEIKSHMQQSSLEDSILCVEIKNTASVIESVAREKVSAYLEKKS